MVRRPETFTSMKIIFASLFLNYSSAFQIGGKQYNTFERIKRSNEDGWFGDNDVYGVSRNVLTGVSNFLTRSTNEGSGTNAIFESTFSVGATNDSSSALSEWNDDLADPSSDTFKEAVNDVINVLQTILDEALSRMGIFSYEFIILGFKQGSVQVDYELSIDVEDIQTAEDSHDASEQFTFNSTVVTESIVEVASDPQVQEDLGITPVLEDIVVDGGDTGTGVIEDYNGSCPPCWLASSGICVPDPSMITLSCNADGMEMRVRRCVMGTTETALLSLDDQTCGLNNRKVRGDGNEYVVSVGLDECTTQMTFGSNLVSFKNHLIGNLPSDQTISTNDQYSIEFECDYLTTYDDVSSTSEVTSSINGGGTGGSGSLGFEIQTFTDSSYSTIDTSGSIQVGTTLYFGVAMTSPINNLVFMVTDCTVKSGQGSSLLEYAVMTDGCPNTRVNFNVVENSQASLNKFNYRVFNFKNTDSDSLNLTCNVVVCSATDNTSTCATTPVCSRRRKRSLSSQDRIGETYFNVATSLRVR